MSDYEMTSLCAQAMGYQRISNHWGGLPLGTEAGPYAPLHDDMQALTLVKKMELFIIRATRDGKETWNVWAHPLPVPEAPCGDDLNRAIVECVALIQKRANAAEAQAKEKP